MPSFMKDLTLRGLHKVTHSSGKNALSNSTGNEGASDNNSLSTQSSHADLNANAVNTAASNGNRRKSPASRPTSGLWHHNSNSTRYSLHQSTENVNKMTTSPLAPRVLSISDGSWVHQKVLLIYGEAADVQRPIDGTMTIWHHQNTFPETQWPVCDSYFKALIHLQPGPNRIRLDFTSPKLPSQNDQPVVHTSWFNINFLPLIGAPPLQLCILLARDSPETFDAPPQRVQREGNGLATAVRKFKMMAYLWQCYTAEQMNKNGFGRRCYRYEEEWQPGTLSWRDYTTGQMRNEVKVHIIRLKQSVNEIQDLDLAQQYGPAQKKGDLFSIAKDAVRAYFAPRPGYPQYVSCMFLDSHWDKQVGTIRGHAALGGGDDLIRLAIFGSHCLYSYPSHIEEVVPAFSDCTPTDTNFVANDCNEAGCSWEAANIGIGAHLHETGHLLGCPHQESGIMLRDYTRLNRSFLSREAFSTRRNCEGLRLCRPQDECSWHRLDALRFRYHPCFRLPSDAPASPDNSVQVWGVENGNVLITAATGIAWIELFPEGDGVCHHWIEYADHAAPAVASPKQVQLTDDMIKEPLPADKRKKKLKIKVFSCGGGDKEVDDFSQLVSKQTRIKLPDGRPGFKSSQLGFSQMQGSQPQELILGWCLKPSRLLRSVRVYHGNSLDGLEFFYDDGEKQLFGKRGGKKGGSDFVLDTRRGEMIIGFNVRAGFWIDGIQILTNTGRRSDMFGNATGGSGHTLIPPRGYSVAGVYGSSGAWIDGFGLIITR